MNRNRSSEKLARLADQMKQWGRRWRAGPDGGLGRRLDTLEARIEHLGAELEGLQDAVHRRAVLEDDRIAELRRRTEPEQLARALSTDARKRGL